MQSKIIKLLVASLLTIVLQACLDSSHDEGEVTSLNEEFLVLDQMAKASLKVSCQSCHWPGSAGSGGIDYMDNTQSLIDNGYIIAGNPDASVLYDEVEIGDMPTTGTMSDTDIDLIRAWILAMPTADADNANNFPNTTFTEVNNTIIQPKCATCHHAGHSIPLIDYDSIVLTVWPGNHAASLLWDSVNAGRMPKTGGLLSQGEMDKIAGWINNGAQDN